MDGRLPIFMVVEGRGKSENRFLQHVENRFRIKLMSVSPWFLGDHVLEGLWQEMREYPEDHTVVLRELSVSGRSDTHCATFSLSPRVNRGFWTWLFDEVEGQLRPDVAPQRESG